MEYLVLFSVSLGAVWQVRRLALAKGLIDIPNERSSHVIATPRGGGLGFVLVFSLLGLVSCYNTPFSLPLLTTLCCSIGISVLSFVDDWLSLSAKMRLLTQLIIATVGLVGLTLFSIAPWPIGVSPFALLGIVWFLNLYNFMDGTDGLAALEAISILTPMGVLFQASHETLLAMLCFSLSACVAGFLVFNLPKAKIFMGDVGSTFLGFFIAMMTLYTAFNTNVNWLYWILLSTCFWLDASVTLLRRVLNRESITQAHKTHAYQRLHQSGWSHGQLLVGLLIVNTVLIVFASFAFLGYFSPQIATLLGLFIGLSILGAIEYKQPRQ
ncbi:MAG: glycosyl transferase [Legionellales bacterium]|nr:glycosyl transferase [Legionellales bacterium]